MAKILIENDKCDGCGTCAEECPMDVLKINESGISTNVDNCMECGLCETVCPNGAVTLVRD